MPKQESSLEKEQRNFAAEDIVMWGEWRITFSMRVGIENPYYRGDFAQQSEQTDAQLCGKSGKSKQKRQREF